MILLNVFHLKIVLNDSIEKLQILLNYIALFLYAIDQYTNKKK